MTTRYLLLAYVLGFLACASAAEIDFSYNVRNLPSHGYGFGKAETYDVAVRIDEPSLLGASINGISVEIPGGDLISTTSGWLSNELTLKRENGKYVNVPDILSKEAILVDGVLTVTFDEPYTIAGPLYAGYSFTVTTADESADTPVMIADGENPDGLYIHTSRSRLKWNTQSKDAGGVSTMRVIVNGNFADNAAAFVNPGTLACSIEDSETTYTLSVANHGLNPVSSIEYSYSLDGKILNGNATFPEPIPAVWGASASVEISVPSPADTGDFTLTTNVTSVNGATNTDAAPATAIPMKVYPFIPVNRPLVEEYTGLWCGWCPRGYVALETMAELYPDEFVGVAYHSGDDMATGCDWPNSPNGFPDGFINRTRASLGEIYSIWPKYASTATPAEISVDVEWADEEQTMLKATSTTRFIESQTKADYGVSYILVIDGLSNPDWKQSNSYSPENYDTPQTWEEMSGKWGEIFTQGPKEVTGLTFNDVALATKELDGFPGSIPTEFAANEKLTHNCVFNLEEIKKKGTLLKDRSKLRVVAALIDRKSGKPVNCNTSEHSGTGSGVESIADAESVVESAWYNLHGVRVAEPKKGMGVMIRIDRLSNGTTNSTKHIF